MEMNKKVIFDDERITQSLDAFVAETGNMGINEYTNGEGRWFATRDQLKRFLINLLTRVIDEDMEYWIEAVNIEELENNDATD